MEPCVVAGHIMGKEVNTSSSQPGSRLDPLKQDTDARISLAAPRPPKNDILMGKIASV